MLLYHGSHSEVINPKIIKETRKGDFGIGFYTTSSLKQAERWAQIRAIQENLNQGFISIFDIEDFLSNDNLIVKNFSQADDEWLDFVMKNRKDPKFEHSFDIVTGPVANDRVYTCLNAFEEGFMSRELVIENLKTYVLQDQILFHTTHSLKFLHYVKTEVVPCK